MTSLVLTIIGADRPGLVEALSRTVADHGGNWLESHMARLAGRFAGILRVSVPRAEAEALTGALAALGGSGLRVTVDRSDEAETDEGWRSMSLELVGADHPGIVRDVSQALLGHHVNIVELETECVPAPMTGEPLFKARASLRVPPDVAAEALSASLERIAADLMVDLRLE